MSKPSFAGHMWTALLSFVVQQDERVAQLQAELDELDQALLVYTWLRQNGMATPDVQRAQLAPQASRALRRWARHMTQSSEPPAIARWLDVAQLPDFLDAKLHRYVQRELAATRKLLHHQLWALSEMCDSS